MQECVIPVDLNDREDYINQYDDSRFNNNLHDYIFLRSMEFDEESKIIIKIRLDFFYNFEDKKAVKRLFFEDIRSSIKVLNNERKDVRRQGLFLTLIGISNLFIAYTFSHFAVELVSEIFMIIGWVMLWEVTDILFFDKRNIRKKWKKYRQLMNAEIIFEE